MINTLQPVEHNDENYHSCCERYDEVDTKHICNNVYKCQQVPDVSQNTDDGDVDYERCYDEAHSACCEWSYEADTFRICSDVYEYQQMQMQEDVEHMDEEDDGLPQGDMDGEDDGLPKDEILCLLSPGLYVDPTEDYDADDFQDTVPVFENNRKYGVRARSTLLPADACDMLKA